MRTHGRWFGAPGLVLFCGLMGLMASVPASAQMVTGSRMPGYAETLGVVLDQRTYPYAAHLTSSSIPGNILWPGDQPTFTFQLVNNTRDAIAAAGKVNVIEYGTRGTPGDVWTPNMFKISDAGSSPINVNIAANGFADVTVSPKIPEKFGAYALVVDLGEQGRQFLTTCVRTFAATPGRVQYPRFCLDALPLDVLNRLGVHAIRYGIGYKPTTDKDFQEWFAGEGAKLKAYNDANVAVLFMVGGGAFYDPNQPLGRPRPWLDANDTMMDTKFDLAWLPSYDPDFQKYCRLFASQYGWPRGPINAFSLWNEPWEGISISGWGADLPRYREIFTHMAQGVDEARKQDHVDVLLGGCDSSSNAMDKLFPDGKDTFLKWFDFLSIHYQGLDPHSTIKAWVDRKAPHGRVKIWDTESWVANTDDRVAAVVAGDRAAGYDRAMGIFGGNIAEDYDYDMRLPDGKTKRIKGINAWSVAAAVGASQHFIGERPFKELLFKNGLPWVMLFDGLPDAQGKASADDGTIVVVGDIGEEFGKDQLLFRTATGLKNRPEAEALQQKLAALPADAPEADRTALQTAVTRAQTLEGASMSLPATGGLFSLYDFYGNPVPAENGNIAVPLDGRGFFLRSNGSKGSFAKLVEAVRNSRVAGIEPLAPVAHDMTAPIEEHPTLRLSLTNILNRPVSGKLNVKLGDLQVDYPADVSFKGNETKEVPVKVTGGVSVPNNTYPLSFTFDAGADGRSVLQEDMHVNVITRRTITVDGKLDDWNGVPPQPVVAPKTVAPSLTEAAWFPFKTFDASVKGGYANGYLAYDKDNFYFAARIADDTPDDGMVRFETRNDDDYYYPETSYLPKPGSVLQKRDVVWAKSSTDVRALQLPGEGAGRTAAAWEDTVKSFAVDMNLPDDGARQVAFYFLDWDDASRRDLKVTIIDAATGKVLDQRDIKDFRLGKYLVYKLAGKLRITFSTNSWISATLSGIFFDPDKSASPVNFRGPAARFMTEDDQTQGNWKGVYGAGGYNIITAAEKYPDDVKVTTPEVVEREALKWPEGVRRYSYRKDPELPSGNMPNHDNVQIAFNVLPPEKKPWYPNPPGTMPGFINYKDTDYEYALNPVAPKYGGGTEIWRLEIPGMPHKHFYPRQPQSPYDGPVKDGKLVITRDGTTRIVEAAIPWSEIPDVKKRLDAGKTIKFTFRVNDNANIGCMELSRLRSVAKRNGSLHVDWTEHWANELEFGWGR